MFFFRAHLRLTGGTAAQIRFPLTANRLIGIEYKDIFHPSPLQRGICMQAFPRLFIAVSLTACVVLAGGCGSKKVAPYPGGGTAGQTSENGRMGSVTEEFHAGEQPGMESLDATGGVDGGLDSNADNQSDAYKRAHGRCSPGFGPIYFAFDQSVISQDQIPTMEQNGKYLYEHPTSRVLIEGNTDYRGTNEYNLALGERRALSAKNYLIQFGIEEQRIRTISYGEERPLFTGSSEEDHAHNRRADFILE
jgi:peptidoglycan-associated lipoprotein